MSNSSPASGTHSLAYAWFVVAIMALGLSALLAIVLVVARMPLLGLGGSAFRTALVLHVVFGVVVWFLAFAAGSWTALCSKATPIGRLPLVIAVVGICCLLASPFIGAPPPVLANYVPMLDSPVFLTGLFAFLLAVAVAGVLALLGESRPAIEGDNATIVQATRWTILVSIVAAIALSIDFYRAGSSSSVLPVTFDDKLWGVGHLMQFVHNLLMVAAWLWLGRRLVAHGSVRSRIIPWLLAAMALSSLVGPYISLHHDVGSPGHRWGYTELMRWATWPVPFLLALLMIAGAWRSRSVQRTEIYLFASMALYFLGCLLGALIQGNATTLVPAHYHGTIGAVTLAYMAVISHAVPRQGTLESTGLWLQRMPLWYGLGIGILVIGLAWSGLMGVPRKMPHAEMSQTSFAYFVAMSVAGLGGLLALGSILTFVGLLIRNAVQHGFIGQLRYFSRYFSSSSRDIRFRALAVTASVIIILGLVTERMPTSSGSLSMRADSHVAEKRKAEIARRFEQGVVMLHAKEYNHALAVFHRVIELSPEMPEAYVNAGFALLGLGRHAMARDFFDEATTLRRDQYNAYYGMALALEGVDDIFGAMQSMETFLHRADRDDPYRRKAEAAVWEWRDRLEKARLASAVSGKHRTE